MTPASAADGATPVADTLGKTPAPTAREAISVEGRTPITAEEGTLSAEAAGRTSTVGSVGSVSFITAVAFVTSRYSAWLGVQHLEAHESWHGWVN